MYSAALIFYHFGSLDAVLLAVMDRVSGERLTRYRSRLHGVASISALSAAMEELDAEDLRLGHLTAVQEIVAARAFAEHGGALARPAARQGAARRGRRPRAGISVD